MRTKSQSCLDLPLAALQGNTVQFLSNSETFFRMSSTCIVQPFDLVKSRLQVHGEGIKGKGMGPFQLMREIRRVEGIRGFYNGLSAALARQITYTSGRMGAFDTLNSLYIE